MNTLEDGNKVSAFTKQLKLHWTTLEPSRPANPDTGWYLKKHAPKPSGKNTADTFLFSKLKILKGVSDVLEF